VKKRGKERRGGGGERDDKCICYVHSLSAAKQDGHDQRMGKSDLDAIHKAIPCALEDSEVVMVSWVVDDGLHRLLFCSRKAQRIGVVGGCSRERAWWALVIEVCSDAPRNGERTSCFELVVLVCNKGSLGFCTSDLGPRISAVAWSVVVVNHMLSSTGHQPVLSNLPSIRTRAQSHAKPTHTLTGGKKKREWKYTYCLCEKKTTEKNRVKRFSEIARRAPQRPKIEDRPISLSRKTRP